MRRPASMMEAVLERFSSVGKLAMAWWKPISFFAGFSATLYMPFPAHGSDAAHSFDLDMRHIFVLNGDGGVLIFDDPFQLNLTHARGVAVASGTSAPGFSGSAPAGTIFSLFSFAHSSVSVAAGDETAIARGEGYGAGVATTYFIAPALGLPAMNGDGAGSASATTSTQTTAAADAEAEASGTAMLNVGADSIGASSATSSQADVAVALGSSVEENFNTPNGLPARWIGTAGADLDLIYRLNDAQDNVISNQPGVPGLDVLVRGDQRTQLAVTLTGDATGIATTGTDAPGIAFAAASASQAVFSARLRGEGSSVSTGGDGSPAIMADLVGHADVSAALDIEGRDANLRTSAQNSLGAWLTTDSTAGGAASALTLSGAGSSISTDGEASPTALLSARGAGGANADILLLGSNAQLSTNGGEAPAAVMIAHAGSDARVHLGLEGRNNVISTIGSSSPGVIAFADATGQANGRIDLSGAGSRIETLGSGSVGGVIALQGASVRGNAVLGDGASISTSGNVSGGLLLHGSGSSVALALALSGAGARIQTAGDHSYGAALFTAGGNRGTASVELSGERSGISTRGSAAPAVVLASTGSTGGAALTLSGVGSYIATEGDQSNSAYLAGDNASVRLSGKGSRITSLGGQSSTILFAGNGSRSEIGSGTRIFAAGIGSYGIRYLDPTFGHNIYNAGTIAGTAGGISGGADIFVQNLVSGTVEGLTGPAIASDFGTIWNSGRIVGNSGIVMDGQTPGNSTIFNSGLIASNLGPSGVAIDLQGSGNDLLHVAARARIIGTIDLGAGDDRFEVGRGVNLHFTFQSLPETFDAGNRPILIDTSGREVIVVDQTALSPTGSLFGWLQRTLATNELALPGIASAVQPLPVMNYLPERPRPKWEEFYAQTGATSPAMWIRPIGGVESQAGNGDLDSVHRTFGGLLLGTAVDVSATTDLALQAGYVHMGERTSGGGQDNQADAFFGLVSAKTDLQNWDLGWSVLGVYGAGETSRVIANNTLGSGYEVAEGQGAGFLAALSASASKDITLSDTVIFTPTAGVTLSWLGPVSYAETGSTANMTYDNESTLSLEGRLQGRLTKQARLFDRLPLNLHIDSGIFLTGDLSSSNRRVTIGGSQFQLDDPESRSGGVFGGVNADLPLSPAGLFTLGAEAFATTDHRVGFSGWLQLRVAL